MLQNLGGHAILKSSEKPHTDSCCNQKDSPTLIHEGEQTDDDQDRTRKQTGDP